jgi:DNA-binding NarL/FixJ family response regulator
MKRTRILLADDHTMFCDTLSKSLLPDYEVVSVGDGRALLRIAADFQPDVVIVDIGMPVLNGLDAGRELRKMLPRAKLVFLTMNTDPYIAREALNIGASGYLLKSSPYTELLEAVHGVVRGESYLTPQISEGLQKIFIRDPRPLDHPKDLTDREKEILQLFAEGKSAKEVANILGIAIRTVWYHKYRIMEELGCKNNAELVLYAVKHAMISPPRA